MRTNADQKSPIAPPLGLKILRFPQLDSTNLHAKRIHRDVPEGTIISADAQSAGKGRLGRKWLSEPGKNLMFSIVLKPTLPVERLGLLSLVSAIAVANAIREGTRMEPDCKWPNDVLLQGRKICGILSEAIFDQNSVEAVIVGIGVNVNQTQFPDDLQPTAISMQLATGRTYDTDQVLASILQAFQAPYNALLAGQTAEVVHLWKQQTSMLGKPVMINRSGVEEAGIAIDIAENGALLVQTESGIVPVLSADVTLGRL